MAIRVKTTWFKQIDGPKSMEQQATVIASTIWRLADQAVANISRANFDILTPQRGFTLLAELSVFMLHQADRMVYGHISETDRQTLVQHIARRLAQIIEENIHETLNDREFGYQSAFIDLVNARCDEYASFDFAP